MNETTMHRHCMRAASGGAMAIALTLSGCTVGPDFTVPDAPHTGRFTANPVAPRSESSSGPQGAAQRIDEGADVPADWWTAFGSPALNTAIDIALAGSPSIAEAEARLQRAEQDYAARAGATRSPAVDAGLDVTRKRIDTETMGITAIPSPGPFTVHGASVQVSYVLDLFGGQRRELEALAASVDYQRFRRESARLTLAGNIVIAAIEEASLRAQIHDTTALADTQRRQAIITDERVRAGAAAPVERERQRGELARTEALLPPLQARLAATRHRLATYLGLPPEAAAEQRAANDSPDVSGVAGVASPATAVPVFHLDDLRLPEALPVGVPSTLARRRPDIRAAEALLHQASANIGVATANLYPRLTLSGSAATQRLEARELLDGFNVWSIGAGLVQPVFRGGELRARRRAAIAAYDEALAAYRDTVLNGLRQVGDALQAVHADASALRAHAEAEQRAATTLSIVAGQYQLGGVSQLTWLDAQRQQRETSLALVRARADRLADTAALLQALAGGWWEGNQALSSSEVSTQRMRTATD